ncbi:MAG: hypothetical protein KatS3mg088_057 [Patescibacteria group bacterium]|nr:MAG: hypothetical protein KatS3mg088_057 [Patescibacteria group bacterium]
MGSIESLVRHVRRERGERSESKVLSAISLLLSYGAIDGFERNQDLDRKGIDFLVRVGSKNYKLSVKSSMGGVMWELDKHPERHRHGDIIFIVPRREETTQEMAERIISLIDGFEERMHNK